MVEATIRAADARAGSLYNVGGGEEATLKAALEVLESIAGRPLEITYGPAASGDMKRTRADTKRISA